VNEYDIEDAVRILAGYRAAHAGARTLAQLAAWVNANSDGWPYWQPPRRASRRLQALVEDAVRDVRRGVPPLVLAADVRAAQRPIRAFLTRQGVRPDDVVVLP
jgi:hypothetical protein